MTEADMFDLQDALNEGAIIAGILLFWGFFAALGLFIGDAAPRGSPLGSMGQGLAGLLLTAAVANVLLYIVFRAIEKAKA